MREGVREREREEREEARKSREVREVRERGLAPSWTRLEL